VTDSFAVLEEWKHTTIGDISQNIQYGYTESAVDEPVGPKFLRISDIQDNNVDWDSTPYCEISKDEKEKYLLEDGDILFARTGGTVGKSFLIHGDIPEAVFASYLIRIQLAEEVNEYYVYYFFKSNDYWRQISEGKKGIGQPNVNSTILSEIELPMPPQKEQERIVAKIEELFSRLDSSVSGLEDAQKRLRQHRRAVLKAAITGKLSERTRRAWGGQLDQWHC
jgi:type I restriction enzyme S subunit